MDERIERLLECYRQGEVATAERLLNELEHSAHYGTGLTVTSDNCLTWRGVANLCHLIRHLTPVGDMTNLVTISHP